MTAPREIALDSARIRRRDDGVIHVVFARNVEVDIEHAKEVTAAIRELTDRPSRVLVDLRGMRRAGILSLRHVAGPETVAVGGKLALLVDSPVSRLIGDVLVAVAKPPCPTRVFTDERVATEWLLEEDGRRAAVGDGSREGESGE